MKAASKLLIPLFALSLSSLGSLAVAQTNSNNETANTPPASKERQNVSPAEKTVAQAQRNATGKEVAREDVKNPQNNQSGDRQMKPQAQSTTSEQRSAARGQRGAEGAQITKDNIEKPKNNESITTTPSGKL